MAPDLRADAESPAVRLKSVGRTPRGVTDACCGPSADARDAEVHDRRHIVNADHDVGGLQVAMHDAGFVRRDQAGDDATRDVQRAPDRQRLCSFEDGREIRALDERHRDVLDAVDVAEIVNSNDVRVRDLARQQQFALETTFDLGRRSGSDGNLGADHLDSDGDAKFRVPGLVDRAHAAHAQLADDVVAAAKLVTNFDWPAACATRAGRRRANGRDVIGFWST